MGGEPVCLAISLSGCYDHTMQEDSEFQILELRDHNAHPLHGFLSCLTQVLVTRFALVEGENRCLRIVGFAGKL